MPDSKNDYKSKPEINEEVPKKELDFRKVDVNQKEEKDLPGKERDYTNMLKLFGKSGEKNVNQDQIIKNNNDNNDKDDKNRGPTT